MTKPIPKTEFTPVASIAAEHCRDALLVTDQSYKILWINREFSLLTGYSFEDVVGRTPGEVLRGPKTDKTTVQQIEQALKNRQALDFEVEYYRKDGSTVWLEFRINPIFDEHGRYTHYLSCARDMTKRRERELVIKEATENVQLRQQERRLLSQVSEWLYSAKSLDELLRVIAKSLETLMPETAGQLFIYSNSRDVLDLKTHWGGATPHPEHIEPDDCWALRRGRAYSFGMRPIEFPCAHVDAEHDQDPYFCLPITAHGQTNGLLHLHFGAIAQDKEGRAQFKTFLEQRWELALLCAEQISLAIANVQLRQELLDQSVRDPLTNLWNRRWFLDAAHRQKSHAQKNGETFTLIAFDVDHFKKFNDTYGHDAGDMVLRAFGAKMIEFFSDKSVPCRMGGEEFMVLCAGLTEEQTFKMAEDFHSHVGDISIMHSGSTLPPISVSAGVAVWPRDGEDIAKLVNTADKALYKAKELGRARVVSAQTLKK